MTQIKTLMNLKLETCMMRKKKKGIFNLLKPAVAFFLAITTGFYGDFGFAAPLMSPQLTPNVSQPAIQLLSVSIPEEIGSIKETFKGQSENVIFIIQDAHAVPDAQRNIEKIAHYLEKQYGVWLVGVEGAAAELDPQIFRSFPDKARLRKVFENYFDRGELAGGTAAAIFSADRQDEALTGGLQMGASEGKQIPALYHGIEDWGLYEEGLRHFIDALTLEPSLMPQLDQLLKDLADEKIKTYSPKLLEADQALQVFSSNTADFMTTLQKLAALQTPEKGSELALLLAENDATDQGDAAIEAEVKKIETQIRESLNKRHSQKAKAALRGLNQQFQDFQTAHITAQAFALFLKELAMKQHIHVRVSKQLNLLTGNQKRMKDMEGTKLFAEFEKYTHVAKETLFRNPEERLLDQRSHQLDLVRRLAKLELNREDLREIKELLARMDAWNVTSDGIAGRGDIARLLEQMKPHLDFYLNAEKRDQSLQEHTEALLGKYGAKSAILIAGGFHSEGLTYKLKAKGISYVLVMPKINRIPDETHYLDHMKGQVSWSSYFEVKNGKVNLYDAFVRGARDRLIGASRESSVVSREQNSGTQGLSPLPPGTASASNAETAQAQADGLHSGTVPYLADSQSTPHDPRLLKNWRDQIIRDLAAQGRITESGRYTRFMDEIARPSFQLRTSPPNRGRIRPSADNFQLINLWQNNIQRFIQGLRDLTTQNQLSEASIAKLLKPAMIPAGSTAPAILAHGVLPASFFPRARVETPRSKRVVSPRVSRARNRVLNVRPRQSSPARRSEMRGMPGPALTIDDEPGTPSTGTKSSDTSRGDRQVKRSETRKSESGALGTGTERALFSEYQIAIPQKFRDMYYAPSIDEELKKPRTFYEIKVKTSHGERPFQMDASIPEAFAGLWKELYEAYATAAVTITGEKSPRQEAIKIIFVKKSPYVIDYVSPGQIVINEFYFEFLNWVQSDGLEPFPGVTVKTEDSDFWGRGNNQYRQGDVTAETGKVINRSDLKNVFHVLTMPVFYSIIEGRLKWQDLYELFDQIYYHDPRGASLMDAQTGQWVGIPLYFGTSAPGFSHGDGLRDLWEIWGPFLDQSEMVERFFNPATAAYELSYSFRYKERSRAFEKGYKQALQDVRRYRWTMAEMKARVEQLRRKGHDLLASNPDLARQYLGAGKNSWVYSPRDVSKQWRKKFALLERSWGAIIALDAAVNSRLNINHQKIGEKDGHKSWLPEERLLLSENYDKDGGRAANTIEHLANIFKYLSVIRWGIGEGDSQQGLYGMPKKTLLEYPGQMVQTLRDFYALDKLKGMSWEGVMQPALAAARKELGETAAEGEIVKKAAETILWREPPTPEDLKKFMTYLYSHYDKELIRQAFIKSVDDFADASRVDRHGVFNPFLMRVLADAHEIYHDALWLVNADVEREIQQNGYPLPWMGMILGTDGVVDPKRFDGMQIYNVRPVYFDTQLMQVLSEVDPRSVDVLIAFLEKRSQEFGGSHFDQSEDRKTRNYLKRAYYFRQPLNYLALIKQYYPDLFKVLCQTKPDLQVTVTDLTERRYFIPLRENFDQQEDYMGSRSDPALEMQGLNIFGFLSVDSGKVPGIQRTQLFAELKFKETTRSEMRRPEPGPPGTGTNGIRVETPRSKRVVSPRVSRARNRVLNVRPRQSSPARRSEMRQLPEVSGLKAQDIFGLPKNRVLLEDIAELPASSFFSRKLLHEWTRIPEENSLPVEYENKLLVEMNGVGRALEFLEPQVAWASEVLTIKGWGPQSSGFDYGEFHFNFARRTPDLSIPWHSITHMARMPTAEEIAMIERVPGARYDVFNNGIYVAASGRTLAQVKEIFDEVALRLTDHGERVSDRFRGLQQALQKPRQHFAMVRDLYNGDEGSFHRNRYLEYFLAYLGQATPVKGLLYLSQEIGAAQNNDQLIDQKFITGLFLRAAQEGLALILLEEDVEDQELLIPQRIREIMSSEGDSVTLDGQTVRRHPGFRLVFFLNDKQLKKIEQDADVSFPRFYFPENDGINKASELALAVLKAEYFKSQGFPYSAEVVRIHEIWQDAEEIRTAVDDFHRGRLTEAELAPLLYARFQQVISSEEGLRTLDGVFAEKFKNTFKSTRSEMRQEKSGSFFERGKVAVHMGQLSGGDAAGGVQNLNSEKAAVFGHVKNNAFFNLDRLFNFTRLKADIEGIRLGIIVDLHRLFPFLPISGNQKDLVALARVDNFEESIIEMFFGQSPPFEAVNGIIGVGDGLLDLFPRHGSFAHSLEDMVRVVIKHGWHVIKILESINIKMMITDIPRAFEPLNLPFFARSEVRSTELDTPGTRVDQEPSEEVQGLFSAIKEDVVKHTAGFYSGHKRAERAQEVIRRGVQAALFLPVSDPAQYLEIPYEVHLNDDRINDQGFENVNHWKNQVRTLKPQDYQWLGNALRAYWYQNKFNRSFGELNPAIVESFSFYVDPGTYSVVGGRLKQLLDGGSPRERLMGYWMWVVSLSLHLKAIGAHAEEDGHGKFWFYDNEFLVLCGREYLKIMAGLAEDSALKALFPEGNFRQIRQALDWALTSLVSPNNHFVRQQVKSGAQGRGGYHWESHNMRSILEKQPSPRTDQDRQKIIRTLKQHGYVGGTFAKSAAVAPPKVLRQIDDQELVNAFILGRPSSMRLDSMGLLQFSHAELPPEKLQRMIARVLVRPADYWSSQGWLNPWSTRILRFRKAVDVSRPHETERSFQTLFEKVSARHGGSEEHEDYLERYHPDSSAILHHGADGQYAIDIFLNQDGQWPEFQRVFPDLARSMSQERTQLSKEVIAPAANWLGETGVMNFAIKSLSSIRQRWSRRSEVRLPAGKAGQETSDFVSRPSLASSGSARVRSEVRQEISKSRLIEMVQNTQRRFKFLYADFLADLQEAESKQSIASDISPLLAEIQAAGDFALSSEALQWVERYARRYMNNKTLSSEEADFFAALYYSLNRLFYPEQLQLKFSPDIEVEAELENLKDQIAAWRGESADISGAIETARRMRPDYDFLKGVSASMFDKASRKLRGQFLSEVEAKILRPLDQTLQRVLSGGKIYMEFLALEPRLFREREPYLNHGYIYPLQIREEPDQKVMLEAFSTGRLMFYSHERIIESAKKFWANTSNMLSSPQTALLPLPRLLKQSLTDMGIETDEQREDLYFKAVKQEETWHAQDYVFGEILSGQGDDFALSHDHMQALAAALLKPEGIPADRYAAALQPEQEIERREAVALDYVEFAGSWGSTLNLLQEEWDAAEAAFELPDKNSHYAAILYFYLNRMAGYLSTYNVRDDLKHHGAASLALELFQRETRLPSVSQDSIAQVLGGSESSLRDKAKKAVEIFRSVYEPSVYTDKDREQIVEEYQKQKRDSPSAGGQASLDFSGGRSEMRQDEQTRINAQEAQELLKISAIEELGWSTEVLNLLEKRLRHWENIAERKLGQAVLIKKIKLQIFRAHPERTMGIGRQKNGDLELVVNLANPGLPGDIRTGRVSLTLAHELSEVVAFQQSLTSGEDVNDLSIIEGVEPHGILEFPKINPRIFNPRERIHAIAKGIYTPETGALARLGDVAADRIALHLLEEDAGLRESFWRGRGYYLDFGDTLSNSLSQGISQVIKRGIRQEIEDAILGLSGLLMNVANIKGEIEGARRLGKIDPALRIYAEGGIREAGEVSERIFRTLEIVKSSMGEDPDLLQIIPTREDYEILSAAAAQLFAELKFKEIARSEVRTQEPRSWAGMAKANQRLIRRIRPRHPDKDLGFKPLSLRDEWELRVSLRSQLPPLNLFHVLQKELHRLLREGRIIEVSGLGQAYPKGAISKRYVYLNADDPKRYEALGQLLEYRIVRYQGEKEFQRLVQTSSVVSPVQQSAATVALPRKSDRSLLAKPIAPGPAVVKTKINWGERIEDLVSTAVMLLIFGMIVGLVVYLFRPSKPEKGITPEAPPTVQKQRESTSGASRAPPRVIQSLTSHEKEFKVDILDRFPDDTAKAEQVVKTHLPFRAMFSGNLFKPFTPAYTETPLYERTTDGKIKIHSEAQEGAIIAQISGNVAPNEFFYLAVYDDIEDGKLKKAKEDRLYLAGKRIGEKIDVQLTLEPMSANARVQLPMILNGEVESQWVFDRKSGADFSINRSGVLETRYALETPVTITYVIHKLDKNAGIFTSEETLGRESVGMRNEFADMHPRIRKIYDDFKRTQGAGMTEAQAAQIVLEVAQQFRRYRKTVDGEAVQPKPGQTLSKREQSEIDEHGVITADCDPLALLIFRDFRYVLGYTTNHVVVAGLGNYQHRFSLRLPGDGHALNFQSIAGKSMIVDSTGVIAVEPERRTQEKGRTLEELEEELAQMQKNPKADLEVSRTLENEIARLRKERRAFESVEENRRKKEKRENSNHTAEEFVFSQASMKVESPIEKLRNSLRSDHDETRLSAARTLFNTADAVREMDPEILERTEPALRAVLKDGVPAIARQAAQAYIEIFGIPSAEAEHVEILADLGFALSPSVPEEIMNSLIKIGEPARVGMLKQSMDNVHWLSRDFALEMLGRFDYQPGILRHLAERAESFKKRGQYDFTAAGYAEKSIRLILERLLSLKNTDFERAEIEYVFKSRAVNKENRVLALSLLLDHFSEDPKLVYLMLAIFQTDDGVFFYEPIQKRLAEADGPEVLRKAIPPVTEGVENFSPFLGLERMIWLFERAQREKIQSVIQEVQVKIKSFPPDIRRQVLVKTIMDSQSAAFSHSYLVDFLRQDLGEAWWQSPLKQSLRKDLMSQIDQAEKEAAAKEGKISLEAAYRLLQSFARVANVEDLDLFLQRYGGDPNSAPASYWTEHQSNIANGMSALLDALGEQTLPVQVETFRQWLGDRKDKLETLTRLFEVDETSNPALLQLLLEMGRQDSAKVDPVLIAYFRPAADKQKIQQRWFESAVKHVSPEEVTSFYLRVAANTANDLNVRNDMMIRLDRVDWWERPVKGASAVKLAEGLAQLLEVNNQDNSIAWHAAEILRALLINHKSVPDEAVLKLRAPLDTYTASKIEAALQKNVQEALDTTIGQLYGTRNPEAVETLLKALGSEKLEKNIRTEAYRVLKELLPEKKDWVTSPLKPALLERVDTALQKHSALKPPQNEEASPAPRRSEVRMKPDTKSGTTEAAAGSVGHGLYTRFIYPWVLSFTVGIAAALDPRLLAPRLTEKNPDISAVAAGFPDTDPSARQWQLEAEQLWQAMDRSVARARESLGDWSGGFQQAGVLRNRNDEDRNSPGYWKSRIEGAYWGIDGDEEAVARELAKDLVLSAAAHEDAEFLKPLALRRLFRTVHGLTKKQARAFVDALLDQAEMENLEGSREELVAAFDWSPSFSLGDVPHWKNRIESAYLSSNGNPGAVARDLAQYLNNDAGSEERVVFLKGIIGKLDELTNAQALEFVDLLLSHNSGEDLSTNRYDLLQAFPWARSEVRSTSTRGRDLYKIASPVKLTEPESIATEQRMNGVLLEIAALRHQDSFEFLGPVLKGFTTLEEIRSILQFPDRLSAYGFSEKPMQIKIRYLLSLIWLTNQNAERPPLERENITRYVVEARRTKLDRNFLDDLINRMLQGDVRAKEQFPAWSWAGRFLIDDALVRKVLSLTVPTVEPHSRELAMEAMGVLIHSAVPAVLQSDILSEYFNHIRDLFLKSRPSPIPQFGDSVSDAGLFFDLKRAIQNEPSLLKSPAIGAIIQELQQAWESFLSSEDNQKKYEQSIWFLKGTYADFVETIAAAGRSEVRTKPSLVARLQSTEPSNFGARSEMRSDGRERLKFTPVHLLRNKERNAKLLQTAVFIIARESHTAILSRDIAEFQSDALRWLENYERLSILGQSVDVEAGDRLAHRVLDLIKTEYGDLVLAEVIGGGGALAPGDVLVGRLPMTITSGMAEAAIESSILNLPGSVNTVIEYLFSNRKENNLLSDLTYAFIFMNEPMARTLGQGGVRFTITDGLKAVSYSTFDPRQRGVGFRIVEKRPLSFTGTMRKDSFGRAWANLGGFYVGQQPLVEYIYSKWSPSMGSNFTLQQCQEAVTRAIRDAELNAAIHHDGKITTHQLSSSSSYQRVASSSGSVKFELSEAATFGRVDGSKHIFSFHTHPGLDLKASSKDLASLHKALLRRGVSGATEVIFAKDGDVYHARAYMLIADLREGRNPYLFSQDFVISRGQRAGHFTYGVSREGPIVPESFIPARSEVRRAVQGPVNVRHSEMRFSANAVVEALSPNHARSSSVTQTEIQHIYEFTTTDLEGFIDAILQVWDEHSQAGIGTADASPRMAQAMVESRRLLEYLRSLRQSGKLPEGMITVGLRLSGDENDSFLTQLFKVLQSVSEKAEVVADGDLAKNLSVRRRRHSGIAIRSVESRDWEKGLKALQSIQDDVPVALSFNLLGEAMNAMFTGLALKRSQAGSDPVSADFESLLMAVSLVEIARISAAPKHRAVLQQLSAKPHEKADYLRAELLKRLANLGYPPEMFAAGKGYLMLDEAIANAYLDMRARSEIRQAA